MEPVQSSPLLPGGLLEGKERKKRRSREKRSHRRRDGDDGEITERRVSPRRAIDALPMISGVGRKEMEQLEVGLKNEIQTLREEFQTMNEHKDRHIQTLEMRNNRLEKQLERMMKMMSKAEVVELVEDM